MHASQCRCFLAGCMLLCLVREIRAQAVTTQPAPEPIAVRANSPAVPPETKVTNFLGLPAAPLDTPIETDRPDLTDSPITIPYGHIQLESGYAYTRDHDSDQSSNDHTLPQYLLRVGLVKDLELRVGWEGFSFTEETTVERDDDGHKGRRTVHQDGGSDLYLGSKIHLIDQAGWVPDFALIPGMTVPTGAADKTSGDVDPEIVLAGSHDVGEKWTVSSNVVLASLTDPAGRFLQTTATFDVGYKINSWLQTYAEYAAFCPNTRGSDAAHYLGSGLDFTVTNNLHLDWSVSTGLNEEAADFSTGVGLGFRF
jgi:hypothetical protein